MALPTLTTRAPSQFQNPGAYMDWQRERRAEKQLDLETHARYLGRQSFCNERHDVWTSRFYFYRSISQYHKQRLKEERKCNLERRKNQIQTFLQEEMNQLEAELRELDHDRKTQRGRHRQKKGEHSTERQESREKVETELHKDHVVGQWLKQLSEKKKWQVSQQEERRFENDYERTRNLVLERMKQAGQQNRPDEKKRMEDLCKHMEELKLKETTELKVEQKALMFKQRQLQKIEKEMKQMEEREKKPEMQRFLVRHYHTQMMQRAEQVQAELEAERKILAALMEGEEEEMMKRSHGERAVADVAWMECAIEEQLQMEREREAKIEDLNRQEAQRLWEQEPQREKERKARELLMQKVLSHKQQQLMMKIQENRKAQQESRKRREELIHELNREKS
ncbi:trichoplein keratin filament-binding protein-like [Takifugu rubripes]|uniref:Trichoplein keratin filament-binding protein-like n=1 Tax=Takifugu rubripes TaxID=31033 RepID=A0A674MRK5_TAKRU|nr:trichoplein keratin filament-binding protein-like [Takifugu rubripes]XP_029683967.1 trichoplein keratin filament-binding protein-like [Takifugu rubripes]